MSLRPPFATTWPPLVPVLGAVLISLLAIDARANTLTVTDCGDTTPGGGAAGQLRRLIHDAGTGDTIVIPACTITLTGSGDDTGDQGDLDVAKDLTIQGAGN